MNSLDMLTDMLLLQQRLNDETNGIGWESGYTKDGKLINFIRCIYMECAELVDSFSWKHWKNIDKKPDWKNIHIEIVDIWHFILSLILEEYKKKNTSNKATIAIDINSVSVFRDFCGDTHSPKDSDIYDILNDIELIIHKCSGLEFNVLELFNAYFLLSIKCGINLEKLYKLYIGKNVLNKFRQDNGYKDGSYIKIWNGKEDNEVLNELLDKNGNFDYLYENLEKIYRSL